jgi:hypothetical protein
MTLKWFVVSAALLTGLGLVGGAGAQQASTRAANVVPAAPVTVPSDYVIGAEDMLQISVWKNESLSRQLPVRPDGKISMPLLHDVQASGLTPMQLRDKIAVALAEFMPNPEVSVTVLEVRSYSPSKIVIFRKDNGGQTQRLRFNYNRAVGAAGEENVTLRSGDVVVVP